MQLRRAIGAAGGLARAGSVRTRSIRFVENGTGAGARCVPSAGRAVYRVTLRQVIFRA
jgi:hypothetical protein